MTKLKTLKKIDKDELISLIENRLAIAENKINGYPEKKFLFFENRAWRDIEWHNNRIWNML